MNTSKRPLHWEPAIYEHKAALISRAPAEVSRSADLLVRAMSAEYEAYRADFMTVGIDVYNLEAEAVGAEVSDVDAGACPEIRTPPCSLGDFSPPPLPSPDAGRFSLFIEAARNVRTALGDRTTIRVAASGPVSIAGKLVGVEPLIMAMAGDDPTVKTVLEYATELGAIWINRIRSEGLEAIVFDSTASPPMCSPTMYKTHIAPLHRRVMRLLTEAGQKAPPLILGGNTVPIVGDIIAVGAGTVICDYTADAEEFASALPTTAPHSVCVRRNVNPALFTATGGDIDSEAKRYVADLSRFTHRLAGTGILPFDADPERYRRFRRRVEALSEGR